MLASIPSPAAGGFHVGAFEIHVYGLMYVVAVIAAGLVWFARSRGWRAGSGRSRWRPPIALAVGGVLLFACGCGESSPATPDHAPPARSRIEAERPPHPKQLDVASPAQERAWREVSSDSPESRKPPAEKKEPPAASAPAEDTERRPPGSLPPASAGTNGSFVPPPHSRRTTISPRMLARTSEREAEGRAVLLSGIALAPPSAPERVKAAISGANELVGKPYVWGGGHGSWYAAGYDCSGAVSYALAAGGLLRAPLTSGQLEGWGAPGPGRWITVYANAGHTYVVLAGLRWDTVGDALGSGPRWHAALPYPEGFVARHPPGL